MSHSTLVRALLVCMLGSGAVAASAQLSNFEDIEAAAQKGFFKEYLAGFWRGFADFGDPFALNGGVALDLRSYDAQGGPDRQDPFFYSLAANTNARIYKLDVPFSLVVTARNSTSSLPNFRELGEALGNNLRDDLRGRRDRLLRFGASPHYKWARLHLGHRAMTFSQFTLSNLVFLGAGAELTPGKLDVGAMYGRLAKAEPIDLSLATPNLPIYRRTGFGAKVGYGDDDASVELILFGARDDVNSLDAVPAGASAPLPEQNLVTGVNAQRLFAERFRAKLEFAHSVISPDLYAAELTGGMAPDFLFERRLGSEGKTAVDAAVDYEGALFTAGLQYQRIDPGYRSFGAYFFNNDVQNILANARFGLFDSKVNMAVSGGVQNDNLDERKPATTRRLVYSVDAGYAGSGGFSAAANYSNNSSDIGYVLNQGLDSLNAVIITEDAGLSLNYQFGDPEGLQHGLNFTGNLQQVNDDVADRTRSAQTQLLLAGLTYSLNFGSGWTVSARTNYTQNELAIGTINRVGFGAGVAKSFLEGKIALAADLNHYLNRSTLTDDGTNLQAQLRTSYRITEQLGLELATRLLRTEKASAGPFREITSTLGLRYTFQYTPAVKKASPSTGSGRAAETDATGG